MSPTTIPGNLILSNTQLDARDTDANAYMAAVEAADGEPLELGVRLAITDFVVGCKADGIWNAIKASCILAGARTTNGALVPLKGTAPTAVNFDLVNDTDYDRKLGLTGNASTKYLDSNFNALSVDLDDIHVSAFVIPTSTNGVVLGDRELAGNTSIRPFRSGLLQNQYYAFANRNLTSTSTANIGPNYNAMFAGSSRSSSSEFTRRADGTDTTALINSESLANAQSFLIFCGRRNTGGTPQRHTDATIPFYSLGQALPGSPTQSGLELLDTRVSTLISDLGAAIP